MMLYDALDYEPPQFAHLPMLLGSDRSKLSKRHGAVSITEYREEGYLPDALFNFLALLGWSLDDRTEIMSRDEIIMSFSLERVSKTAAIFNTEKLDWINGVYIRSLAIDNLTERALPFMEKYLPEQVKRPLDVDYVRQMMPLLQERARTLKKTAELADFFFLAELEYDPALLIGKKMDREMALKALDTSMERLDTLATFDAESLETLLRPLAEELGLKTGQFFGTLRVAVTGRTAAPPLFQTMVVLGRERCLSRINSALDRLKQIEA
jgi:glutamyl-tRNA synthetase